MKSFLLIGQSNMAGRGDFGDVPEIKNPDCFMLRNGRWQHMSEPINPDRNIFTYFHSGRGLSASFADEYAKHFEEQIGLIPCAEGGSRLDEWMPGELLYDHAIGQARLAMRTSELAGILWHQGESDCHSEEDARTYQQRFIKMITRLREDLGNKDLPLIVGGLGDYLKEYRHEIKYKHTATVQKALEEMPLAVSRCGFASAEGLTDRGDGIHFNSKSYRIFGKRYFDEYLKIAKK